MASRSLLPRYCAPAGLPLPTAHLILDEAPIPVPALSLVLAVMSEKSP